MRRSGELEILLTTPYDEVEILRGCFFQVIRGLYWPTLFALGVDLALLIMGSCYGSFGGGLAWAGIVVIEIVWMLVNLYSLSWVGLFQGLKLANSAKAAGRALFNVVLLPWIVGICCAGLAVILAPANTESAVVFIIAVVFLSALTFCNFYFTGLAISDLRDNFRSWAAQA